MELVNVTKRYFTLIEMMIVMTLIILLIGVLGYNYTRVLEEGKAFKTKAGMLKLETILSLAIAQGSVKADDIPTKWEEVVKDSPLVRNPDDLIKDGWGNKYDVQVENGVVIIRSERYETYIQNNPTMFGDK